MKIIQKGFELSKLDYYKTHLKILNAIFPVGITDKEIEILSNFLSLPQDITRGDMFNTVARKRVIEDISLTSGGMSNHLKNMKKKGFLKKENEKLVIIPSLLPGEGLQGYNFKLKMNG